MPRVPAMVKRSVAPTSTRSCQCFAQSNGLQLEKRDLFQASEIRNTANSTPRPVTSPYRSILFAQPVVTALAGAPSHPAAHPPELPPSGRIIPAQGNYMPLATGPGVDPPAAVNTASGESSNVARQYLGSISLNFYVQRLWQILFRLGNTLLTRYIDKAPRPSHLGPRKTVSHPMKTPLQQTFSERFGYQPGRRITALIRIYVQTHR